MRSRTKKNIIFFCAIVIVGATLGYVYYQARTLIAGPVIVVEAPENFASVEKPLVEIRGTAENISFLTLNDRQIFVDEEGIFLEHLILPKGYSIIKIEAKDKFGRVRIETLELFKK